MNSNVMKAKYCRIVYFHCFYLRNTTELPEKAILYQVGFSRVVFQYPTKKKKKLNIYIFLDRFPVSGQK